MASRADQQVEAGKQYATVLLSLLLVQARIGQLIPSGEPAICHFSPGSDLSGCCAFPQHLRQVQLMADAISGQLLTDIASCA